MAQAIGLYGHVRDNHVRSLYLFAGFLLAFHLLALVALFLPLAMFDSGHAPFYDWGGYARRYLLAVTAVAAALYAAQMWWHVNSVRRETQFRYVDSSDEPRLCRILEPLIIAAGIRTPFVGLIDSPAMNAFACGFRPSHMVVVVTRGLVDGLDDDELAAVLAHEIIHIRNRDTRLMAAANVFMRNMTLLQSNNSLRIHDWRQGVLIVLMPVFLPLILASGAITALAFRLGYCSRALISSAREYIADAEAVRLTQNPAALVAALAKVEGRERIAGTRPEHEAMMIAGATSGPQATHPSIAERIAALARVTGSMTFIAPARLDTRPEAQRAGSGFGRRGAGLESAAALAAEPHRPGMFEIFRLTADPDRNLVGLTRQGMMIVVIAFAALLLIYHRDVSDPAKFAGRFDLGVVGAMGEVTGLVARCTTGGLIGGSTEGCDEKSTNDVAGKLLGMEFKTVEDPALIRSRQAAARRCFSSFHDGPSLNWPLTQTDESRGGSMALYLRFAGLPRADVMAMAAGPERDKELQSYAASRKLLTDHAYHFYGMAGVDAFNRALDTAEHRAMLGLIKGRMWDAKFTTDIPYNNFEKADLAALVEHPGDYLPCEARDAGVPFKAG